MQRSSKRRHIESNTTPMDWEVQIKFHSDSASVRPASANAVRTHEGGFHLRVDYNDLTLKQLNSLAKKLGCESDLREFVANEVRQTSSNLEARFELLLKSHNISYEKQKTFPGLSIQRSLRYDFYLPEYKLLIECDGEQHFRSIAYFGGEEGYHNTLTSDILKEDYAAANPPLSLLRIGYWQFGGIEDLLEAALARIKAGEKLLHDRIAYVDSELSFSTSH